LVRGDGLLEAVTEFVVKIRSLCFFRLGAGSGKTPVRSLPDRPVTPREPLCRTKTEDAAVDRGGSRHRELGERRVERVQLDLGARASGDERVDLGGEGERVDVTTPIQRLDAKRVPREGERCVLRIPDGDRVHAAQMGKRSEAPAGPGCEHDFRVAVGAEREGWLQFAAQIAEIVDRPIEDERVTTVWRLHRLAAPSGIKNGQASHTESRLANACPAGVVWSAVHHRRTHAIDRRFPVFRGGTIRNESRYAAHEFQRTPGGAAVRGCIRSWLRPVTSLRATECGHVEATPKCVDDRCDACGATDALGVTELLIVKQSLHPRRTYAQILSAIFSAASGPSI